MKAKNYGSENDAASVANEQHCMNCYKSENEVFSFCPVSARFEKNGPMRPEKIYETGRQSLDLSPILFQRAFRRFIGKDMRRKNRRE
jgi:hypothetical protein